ncbi:MAG: FAD-dependent oxidoreductase, partial [Gemmatimonadota bacterium]
VVAADRDNLLVGGRPISVDHAIHSSMRVMPPACTVGQAAGLGAAMAVERGCAPGELDGTEVRQVLVEMGAPLAAAAPAPA